MSTTLPAEPYAGGFPAPLRARPPRLPQPAHGFTLLEMLIALTIIGLMIGLAVPWVGRGGGGAGLDAAASEIRAALHAARASAIADGRTIGFRGDAGAYWLGGYRYRLGRGGGAGGVRVATAGTSGVAFYPSGASSGGRILLQGGNGRREIVVDAVTGRATLVR